jgi:hypothetical protein
METEMNKLILIAAAFAAFTVTIGSAAEAGGCGGTGYTRSYRPAYRSVARRVTPKVQVAKTQAAPAATVAKVEPEAKTETAKVAAVTENSTIATTDEVAETDVKQEKVATAAKEVGCKQFVPAAGLTVSVSCNN